jgi:hypothetical protein
MDITLHSPLAWLLWWVALLAVLVELAIATLVLLVRRRRHSHR